MVPCFFPVGIVFSNNFSTCSGFAEVAISISQIGRFKKTSRTAPPANRASNPLPRSSLAISKAPFETFDWSGHGNLKTDFNIRCPSHVFILALRDLQPSKRAVEGGHGSRVFLFAPEFLSHDFFRSLTRLLRAGNVNFVRSFSSIRQNHNFVPGSDLEKPARQREKFLFSVPQRFQFSCLEIGNQRNVIGQYCHLAH